MSVSFPVPEPTVLWTRFFELVAVPRPSKAEQPAIDYLNQWAVSLGFASKRDAAGNLVVHVPATSTTSQTPIILQCHVDIVSVTASGDHGADASRGLIPLVRGDLDPANEKRLTPNDAGDWINAPYTTLGADNGIGVAMMMALAESSDRPVPMQLLFTTDEEAGMSGAFGIDAAALGLTGKLLINIDTEDDAEITIGAAGGRDVEVTWTGEWEPSQSPSGYKIVVTGMKGGHSGIEINQGRANANRLLARTLKKLSDAFDVRLKTIRGGSRRNAIPDISEAIIVFDIQNEQRARQLVDEFASEVAQLYANRDNPIHITLQSESNLGAGDCLSVASTRTLVHLIAGIPTGICEMTPEIPVLVESSCNLAILSLESTGQVKIICSARGTTAQALNDVCDTLRSIAQLGNATVTVADGYPGWKPNLNSRLLKTAIEQYAALFGSEPVVHAVHAGLECGLLLQKLPGSEAISIGPNIKGNHAVGERVQISSVAKSYRYVVEILKKLV